MAVLHVRDARDAYIEKLINSNSNYKIVYDEIEKMVANGERQTRKFKVSEFNNEIDDLYGVFEIFSTYLGFAIKSFKPDSDMPHYADHKYRFATDLIKGYYNEFQITFSLYNRRDML